MAVRASEVSAKYTRLHDVVSQNIAVTIFDGVYVRPPLKPILILYNPVQMFTSLFF